MISIHALLAESDNQLGKLNKLAEYFYPRSPCGERPAGPKRSKHQKQFLSTLSLRRATCIIDIINNVVDNFYPRSPCGERHILSILIIGFLEFLSTLSLRRATPSTTRRLTNMMISIHALLAESDSMPKPGKVRVVISIHALLAESDALGLLGWLRVLISIHALLAESDVNGICLIVHISGFLSTLSLRRATTR